MNSNKISSMGRDFWSRSNKFIIAHPGAQHSHYLAIALQESSLLELYVTGLYTAWSQRPFSYGRWLPKSVRSPVEKIVFTKFRRSANTLNDDNVLAIQWFNELAIAIASRLGASSRWRAYASQKLNLGFQRDLANLVLRIKPGGLVCYDKSAFETFSLLQRSDTKLILDQSTAHPAYHESILKKERQLQPDFADTIILPSEKVPWYKRWWDEAELADHILAGSNFVKHTLIDNGISAEKILVINYGIDTNRFKPAIKKHTREKFTVLFVGSIMQRKGIAYLLEAVSRLNLPNLELLLCGNIAGNGKGLKPYEKYFRHLGHISHYMMPTIYSQADVFVMPSLVEGLAQVNLEALACGIPIITTLNSGAADIIEDGVQGFLIPIRDTNALAERIEFLYHNREKCIEMGSAGRKIALNHDWQRYNAQITQVFPALLSS